MTTDTDTIETELDEPTDPTSAEFYKAAKREPQPTAAYDDLRTPDEINVRYKGLFAAAIATAGSPFRIDRAVVDALQEDLRRAFVRISFRKAGSSTGTRAPSIPLATPIVAADGTAVIECIVCHETKPEKKFPTVTGGARQAECRDCRDARLEEQRKAKR